MGGSGRTGAERPWVRMMEGNGALIERLVKFLRMDYISRQKQWEAEQARIAAKSTAALEDDEMAPDDAEDGGLWGTTR